MDFEGISLRRKFLTGLEPESINLMIGWCFCLFKVTKNKCAICKYNALLYKEVLNIVFSTVRFFASRKAWKAE